MVTIPRLVVAAPASGCGKTTVATGLLAALRARGVAVSGHKVGPDYIDPGYHALASGRPGRNLDPFLCGEDLVAPLFAHGAAGAKLAVVEGVMGLFDGVADAAGLAGAGPDHASTAHVARLIGAPVVLVVDAAASGRSVAAVVAGFAGFDPRVRIAGVILNRVGSQRHERLLTDAVESIGVRVYGAIARTDGAVTPSRHLGLVPAAERRAAAARWVALVAGLVARSCDLAGLQAVAASAPALATEPWDPAIVGASSPPAPGRGRAPVVAVAEGPAFTFSYTEHAELLREAGAQIAPFDPLADEDLPAGAAGLVIGGGFPETYAAGLSANTALRRKVFALAESGAPIVAECAGLLYLARSLDGLPMCGVIGARGAMVPALTLGYRTGEAGADSVITRAGEPVRGHEFHRTAAAPRHGRRPAWRLHSGLAAPGEGGGRPHRTEGHVTGNVLASYLHTHWARTPGWAARFVAACRSGVTGAGQGVR